MSTFQKLEEESIIRLNAIFRKRLPRASQHYNFLKFYLTGITKKIGLPTEFYWYNALELDKAYIVVKLRRAPRNETVWIILAPESGNKDAVQAFSQMVNWNQANSFNFVDEAIMTDLIELCEQHGGPSCNAPADFCTISIEDALKLGAYSFITPDKAIAPLTPEEIPILMEHWKFSDNQDVDEIIGCVENIPSAGLHVDGKLVSWAFTALDGGIHSVFTLPEYRGHGYGQILLKYLCFKLAEAGLIPIVHVECANAVSLSMMKKIGFEFSHVATWLNL